jgi:hypothetical protein
LATKRREALKYGLGMVGAAVGLGAAGKVLAAQPASEAEPKQATSSGSQFVLYGAAWRIGSEDLRRGELPRAGTRLIARGEILDKPANEKSRQKAREKSQKVGDFFATYYQVNAPGKVAAHEPGSLELHTFVLPEGTILGSGLASAAADSEGVFAIIGGTGRYLGARGSYVARQSYADFGGNGTASFTFNLL